MHQKIGNEAREQGARPDCNEVGCSDGIKRLRKRLHVRRHEKQFANFPLAGGNTGLAADARPILELGLEFNRRSRGRENMSAGEKNFGRQTHRLGEVSRDRSQRGQKKIAEAVALEPRTFLKAMLEEPREQSLVFRECNDAVSYVA